MKIILTTPVPPFEVGQVVEVIAEFESLGCEFEQEQDFDWTSFWSVQSPWFKFAAMDSDGKWRLYGKKPDAGKDLWRYSVLERITILIPDEYAPPRAEHWNQSLVAREGAASE